MISGYFPSFNFIFMTFFLFLCFIQKSPMLFEQTLHHVCDEILKVGDFGNWFGQLFDD